MARLQSASIRLVQKMNRQNKNGEFPIYIVICFKGRKEKASGISCLPKYWDGVREVIKKSCPNAAVLNKMLNDIKQRCIEKRNYYELNGKVYTASMLLEDSVVDLNGKTNEFKKLMNDLCNERRLKSKSIEKYTYTFSKVSEYLHRDDFIVDELNVGFVKDFVRWFDVSDNTKRYVLGCIAAVWNYAISKGICDASDYPFREYRFTQKFKIKSRDYCIDLGNMKKLKEYFLDLVSERNGNRWKYKEGAWERLGKRTSEEFCILYFLIMYHLNGSAPIDVALLKVVNCESINIEGVDYWKIEFKRQKTGVNVSVRLKRNVFSIIMLEHFLGRSKSKYVYPIITNNADTFEKIISCSNNFGEVAIKWVRKAFKAINQKTIEYNAKYDKEEPLVDISKVVLYTARHSFASNYLNSEGATVVGAASLLARSANTIATYIHQLQGNKEIAKAVSFLDD